MSPTAPLAVGTLLPAQLQQRVRSAIVPPGEVFRASDSHQLKDWISAAWSDAVIVDPEGDYLEDGTDIRDWPEFVPIVVYLRLSHSAAKGAALLARTIPFDLIVYGYGDDPATLRSRITNARAAALGRALFTRLDAALDCIPQRVRAGIATFCDSARPSDSVVTLAAMCGLARTSLWRMLVRVGLNPLQLVIAARLVRAHSLLVRREISPAETARALRVASVQTLRRQLMAVSGCSLEEVQSEGCFDSFVDRVAEMLLVPATN